VLFKYSRLLIRLSGLKPNPT